MPYTQTFTLRKGFSLVELLIVIMIVALIYAAGFSGIDVAKSKPKALTPLNLKDNIVKSEFYNGRATLMCLDKCAKCYLRQGLSSKFTPYSNGVSLKDTTAYTIDNRDSLQEIEYERFNDRPICLVIDFYNNGSSTQIILKDDTGAYFLPAFFGDAKKFDTIDDAKRHWLKSSQDISSSGEYY
jgi:prepilin-type N-terminal cleavage/methylation domain-containing protein